MGDEHSTRLMRTPKQGERILPPTLRPDGTFRKAVRIRPGYTPPDEVAVYKSKGALMRISAEVVVVTPGYEPSMDGKLKTKSAKRNERKKEKKLQAALSTSDKGKSLDSEEAAERVTDEASVAVHDRIDSVELVTEGINNLSVSLSEEKNAYSNAGEFSDADIGKRIRALKKKIRLAEGQLKGEDHAKKIEKIEGWLEELKLLEDKKTNQAS